MRSHHRLLLAGLALLAPLAYAGNGTEAAPANSTPPQVQPRPASDCSVPCIVMKVSTRCECPVGKTLPTVAVV